MRPADGAGGGEGAAAGGDCQAARTIRIAIQHADGGVAVGRVQCHIGAQHRSARQGQCTAAGAVACGRIQLVLATGR